MSRALFLGQCDSTLSFVGIYISSQSNVLCNEQTVMNAKAESDLRYHPVIHFVEWRREMTLERKCEIPKLPKKLRL